MIQDINSEAFWSAISDYIFDPREVLYYKFFSRYFLFQDIITEVLSFSFIFKISLLKWDKWVILNSTSQQEFLIPLQGDITCYYLLDSLLFRRIQSCCCFLASWGGTTTASSVDRGIRRGIDPPRTTSFMLLLMSLSRRRCLFRKRPSFLSNNNFLTDILFYLIIWVRRREHNH